MTIGLQAYLQGYMHDKTASRGRRANDLRNKKRRESFRKRYRSGKVGLFGKKKVPTRRHSDSRGGRGLGQRFEEGVPYQSPAVQSAPRGPGPNPQPPNSQFEQQAPTARGSTYSNLRNMPRSLAAGAGQFVKGKAPWKGSAKAQERMRKERKMSPAQRRFYKHRQQTAAGSQK